jgi:DNA-binding PadR family transcriptional regulator
MAARSNYQNRIELLQGTLDMLILRTLQWGHQHGHGIGQAIRANSGASQVETGSYRPCIGSRDRAGSLRNGLSENKQRAGYYRLTAAGKATVRGAVQMGVAVKAITGVMKPVI